MKKLFKSNRLPMLSALCGSLLLLGCTNEDYDFDKVDYTLGFGSGDLVLPSNNSVTLKLDDILDLSGNDLIKTITKEESEKGEGTEGDYMLSKVPEDVNPITVKIDPLVQKINESGEQSFSIDIPDEVKQFAGVEIDLTNPLLLGKTLDAEGDVSLISYKFDVDKVVKDLTHVGLGYDKGVNLRLNVTLPNVIKKANVSINLPRNFDMSLTQTSDPKVTFDNTDNINILTLTDFNASQPLSLTFNVKGINIKKYDDKDYATYNPETLEMILISNISLKVQIATLQVPSTPTIEIKGTPSFDDIVVTSARGVFDPDINLDDVGTVTINDIPDFLNDNEVKADLDNPLIWLTLKTNMPLGGDIDAEITSDTYGKSIAIDGIELNAKADGDTQDAETKILICRYEPKDVKGFTVKAVPELSKLIETLKDGMQLSFRAKKAKAKQVEATVELGKDYYLKPKYDFSAALALGDNAAIVYSDKEVDWNKDIDKLELSDNSKILLTANVENGVPADLEINITPLDKNGNKLNALTVTPIKNKIAAGATSGEIQYEISDASGKALKQLDGVDYRLKVTAPSDAAQKGKTLNKNQEIKIKDIKMQLNGKVIYDAN